MSTFLNSLKNLGHLNQIHMTLAVVGSRKIELADDFASQGWEIFAPNLSIYGFDADEDACNEANSNLEERQINWRERHVPLALSDRKGESTLYVTLDPMCSSLYPPNEPFLAQFRGLMELMALDFTVDIETTTLDDFCQQEGIEEVDFLKVDVQGADLKVIKGSLQLLKKSILAIQTEIEPSPLYINQPLFSDLDLYLRQQGFTLFDFGLAYRPRARSPIRSSIHPGQLLWGDAFYFYDLMRTDLTLERPKTPYNLLKLACIADAMSFPDYALFILEFLTLQYGKDPTYNFSDVIVETFAQLPALVEQGLETFEVVQNIQPFLSEYGLKYL